MHNSNCFRFLLTIPLLLFLLSSCTQLNSQDEQEPVDMGNTQIQTNPEKTKDVISTPSENKKEQNSHEFFEDVYEFDFVKGDFGYKEDGLYIYLLAENNTSYTLCESDFYLKFKNIEGLGKHKGLHLSGSESVVYPGEFLTAKLNLSEWYSIAPGWNPNFDLEYVAGYDLEADLETKERLVGDKVEHWTVTDYWFDEDNYLVIKIMNLEENSMSHMIYLNLAVTLEDGSFFVYRPLINYTNNCDLQSQGGTCEAVVMEHSLNPADVENILFGID